MRNPLERLTTYWRQSAPARTSHRQNCAANLGVERLEVRSLLSAASVLSPSGQGSHFEDALYDHPVPMVAQSQYGQPAHDVATTGGSIGGNGFQQQQDPRAPQHAAATTLGSEASRRPAYSALPTFYYIVTFSWTAPPAESEPSSPAGFAEDFNGIEQPRPSGSSRPLAIKAPTDASDNSSAPPVSELLDDTPDRVRPSDSAHEIVPLASTPLAETQSTATRFAATLRAHDAVFQALINSAVAQRQDIETWALASADGGRWARTGGEVEAESIDSEGDADAKFELGTLDTLRRVTDAQAGELADLLNQLEQQAPRAWRRSLQGHSQMTAEGAVTDAGATTDSAIPPDGAVQSAAIDEAGGMVLLHPTRTANATNSVIDALDAALAIDELDQFLLGKFAGHTPVMAATGSSERYDEAQLQATGDSTVDPGRSESVPSSSPSILPLAAAGMGAMVIAGRGGRWREWLKIRRNVPLPGSPR